jgi:hypothetical protein
VTPPPPVTHPAPSAVPAPVDTVATLATGSVEGLVRVERGRWRKNVGAGATVILVPAGVDFEGVSPDPEGAARRIAELGAEAVRLQREAEKAMHGSNFTEATIRRDELMAERQAVLAERSDLLAAEHGRRENAAREAAVTTVVADAKGWYHLPDVPPGSYRLYARWVRDDVDLEWIEPVTVQERAVRVDLDDESARGALPE